MQQNEHCEKCGVLEPYGLSKTEKLVLDRICLGEANKEIAYALNITESTVKVHVRMVLLKIGTTNRTKAALIALGHLVLVEEPR